MTPCTALVLGGGGARGAYEAGVVRYLRGPLAAALGAQPRLDILCGTSIGAVNACFLASTADQPAAQGEALAEVWRSLRLEDVYRFSGLGLAALPLYVWRELRARRRRADGWRLADFVYPEALWRVIERRIDWPRLHANVRAGHLEALTVTATDLGTGKAVVFVEARGELPPWSHDPEVEARARSIGPAHALASGALPLLFRPVALEGSWFTDGAVRMNVPLAPALRLGATRVLVVTLGYQGSAAAPPPAPSPRPSPPADAGGEGGVASTVRPERSAAAGGAESKGERSRRAATPPAPPPPLEPPTTAAQLGRILSALLVDHTEYDLDRLRRVNGLVAQGERAFGPGFEERLAALAQRELGQPLRRVEELAIRPSRDLGQIARAHAQRRVSRLRPGTMAARLLERVATGPDAGEEGAADLASYLLFDREYAEELLALGFEDARAAHARLAAFFGGTETPAGARSA